MTPDDLERFWRLVEPEPNSGCWLWVGAAARGYGPEQHAERRTRIGGSDAGKIVSSEGGEGNG